jgi:hypothetical protein
MSPRSHGLLYFGFLSVGCLSYAGGAAAIVMLLLGIGGHRPRGR